MRNLQTTEMAPASTSRAGNSVLQLKQRSVTLPQVQDIAVTLVCEGKVSDVPKMLAPPDPPPPVVCLVHVPGLPAELVGPGFAGTSGGVVPVRARESNCTAERSRCALLESPAPVRFQHSTSGHTSYRNTSTDAKDWPDGSYIHCLTAEELADGSYPLPVMHDGELCASDGYVCTQPRGCGIACKDAPEVAALDCEMVCTGLGLELARASLVAKDGSVLLDELVQPANPVVDHLTAHSGITASQLANASSTKASVQSKLLQLIADDTVLVGHSLEGDLRQVGLIHSLVMDTAILYPNPKGFPFKSSLKALAKRHLLKDIQSYGTSGHDSVEDARDSLSLALLKLTNGVRFATTEANRVSLHEKLASPIGGHSCRSALVAQPSVIRRYGAKAEQCPISADVEAVSAVENAVNKSCAFVTVDMVDISYAQAARERRERDAAEGLAEAPDQAEEDAALLRTVQECESTLSRIRCSLPPGSMLLICSPHVRQLSACSFFRQRLSILHSSHMLLSDHINAGKHLQSAAT